MKTIQTTVFFRDRSNATLTKWLDKVGLGHPTLLSIEDSGYEALPVRVRLEATVVNEARWAQL